MGHIIQRWGREGAAAASTEILRCLQEMPVEMPTNTCYTAGQWSTQRFFSLKALFAAEIRSLIPVASTVTYTSLNLSNVPVCFILYNKTHAEAVEMPGARLFLQ